MGLICCWKEKAFNGRLKNEKQSILGYNNEVTTFKLQCELMHIASSWLFVLTLIQTSSI